jgi:hypothetical protein
LANSADQAAPAAQVDERDAASPALGEQESIAHTGRGRRTALVVVLALAVASLLGWALAGLPGVGNSSKVNTALLIAALISGGLTVIFVIYGLRKARTTQQLRVRDGMLVLVSGLITGLLTILQLISTTEQLMQR